MDGAICDLLEHEPLNKDVADKILDGHCPNCDATPLVRWTRYYSDEMGTHFHCMSCDSDYVWPIAWEPPLPIIKMESKSLSPLDRRIIAGIAKRDGVSVSDWWQPIMQSDIEPKQETITLICYECNKEKKVNVIMQAGYWHWKRGCHARGWVNTDNGLYFDKERNCNVLLARCGDCYKKDSGELK